VVHRPPIEAFRADTPYVIALVDMQEGFRIMVNLRGERALGATIDARVEIYFESASAEIWLPQARLLPAE
jgi:uncharacterized OB-fold protein